MGRTVEVNSNVVLALTLWDGSTARGCRARVYNSAGTEIAGSPFTLTHRTNGHYTGTGWLPTTEGQFSVSYEIYTDGTFATADRRYQWGSQEVEVRSIDQDLATLLTRIGTPTAASIAADIAAVQTKLGTPSGASVSVDIAAVQTKLGTPAGASVSADIASVNSDSNTLVGRLSAGRATNLDNLDAAVSTRASAAQAT